MIKICINEKNVFQIYKFSSWKMHTCSYDKLIENANKKSLWTLQKFINSEVY